MQCRKLEQRLYFVFDAGQEHGMVVHCMNREHKTNKGLENKVLKQKEDNLVQLEKKRVYFSQNNQNLLEVHDHDTSSCFRK